jgi:hypothetical protein
VLGERTQCAENSRYAGLQLLTGGYLAKGAKGASILVMLDNAFTRSITGENRLVGLSVGNRHALGLNKLGRRAEIFTGNVVKRFRNAN